MKNIILRSNAFELYIFISYILHNHLKDDCVRGRKILDCGAGGPLPPLALFNQLGFDTYGIDISDEQMQKAVQYCNENKISPSLQKGDMRNLPFEDGSFDYVYEQQSMCHLTKKDTARAIDEMYRGLKKGGLCFLGMISTDTWPFIGREKEPGEFHSQEDTENPVVHSAFDDDEAEQYLSDWEIIRRDKRAVSMREYWKNVPLEEWMEIHEYMSDNYTRDEWEKIYDDRLSRVAYVHMYYILRKS